MTGGEQRDPGVSLTNKSRHAAPRSFMKSLKSQNVGVPLHRSLDVAYADGYVINSFKLHDPSDRIAVMIMVECVVLNALVKCRGFAA
jgi:hypothetical protein